MRAPGAILLVSCYELGHQPMGLAAPLGALRAAGYEPSALDYSVEGFDGARVEKAAFVGISAPMHTALRLGARFAERVREVNPGAFICFYGLYAGLNAAYLPAHGADAVLGGEFVGPLLEQIAALDPDRPSAPLPAVLPDREALPPPARYARLEYGGELRLAAYVEATRGCKHRCTHCPIPPLYQGRFVVVPREDVLADIRAQVGRGAAHVTFGDPDFLNGPGHSLRVVRAMNAEFPELTFDFTAKVEHLLKHRGLLPELRGLGCLFVVSAVESLNPEVLGRLEKGHTGEDAAEAVRLLRAAGITLRPSLVPFTPWETLDSYLELLEWVAAEALVEAVDPVHYGIRLLVPPGSLLLERAAMQPYLGRLDQSRFSYRWRHPDPRMDRLQEEAAAAVEAAEGAREPVRQTFLRVRELAYAARGEPAPALDLGPEPDVRPPRLTESWFC